MGIAPHSKNRSYFIYCVGQKPEQIAAFRSAMQNSNVPHKELRGRYDGQNEISFISPTEFQDTIMPWLNAQESILRLEDYDARDRPKATLHFLQDGSERSLGVLVSVPEQIAIAKSAYTYDPNFDRYFICKHDPLPDCHNNRAAY